MDSFLGAGIKKRFSARIMEHLQESKKLIAEAGKGNVVLLDYVNVKKKGK
jgi:hypothetical protein